MCVDPHIEIAAAKRLEPERAQIAGAYDLAADQLDLTTRDGKLPRHVEGGAIEFLLVGTKCRGARIDPEHVIVRRARTVRRRGERDLHQFLGPAKWQRP